MKINETKKEETKHVKDSTISRPKKEEGGQGELEGEE